jgi:hypothetical protein
MNRVPGGEGNPEILRFTDCHEDVLLDKYVNKMTPSDIFCFVTIEYRMIWSHKALCTGKKIPVGTRYSYSMDRAEDRAQLLLRT